MNTDNTIDLAWEAPVNAGAAAVIGYLIERAIGEAGSFAAIGDGLTPDTTGRAYEDTGLSSETRYRYRVRTVTSVGASEPSDEDSATTAVSTFRDVRISESGPTAVRLSWQPPAGRLADIIDYQVTYVPSDTTVTVAADLTEVLISGLSPNTRYTFGLVARLRPGAAGVQSHFFVITTPAAAAAVTAPENFTAVPTRAGIVLLSWDALTVPLGLRITGYQLERAEGSGAFATVEVDSSLGGSAGFITTNGSDYTDIGLEPGTTYRYRVTAVSEPAIQSNPPSSPELGEMSDIRTVTTITLPDEPRDFTATVDTNGSGAVRLSWFSPTNTGSPSITVTRYRLEKAVLDLADPTAIPVYMELATVPAGGMLAYTDTNPGVTELTVLSYRLFTINSVADTSAEFAEIGAVIGGGAPFVPEADTPTAPTNLLLRLDADVPAVTLTWSRPTSAGTSPITGYNVFRNRSMGVNTTPINPALIVTPTVATMTYTYTDRVASFSGILTYHVVAVNGSGEGEPAQERVDIPDIPGAPTGLTAVAGADGFSADLSWIAPSDGRVGTAGVSAYRIAFSLADDPATPADESSPMSLMVPRPDGGFSNPVIYTQQGLQQGVYSYRVYAINSVGEGSASDQVTLDLSAIMTSVPSSPRLIEVRPGATSVVISWTAPESIGGSPILGYQIVRYLRTGPSSSTTTQIGGSTAIDTVLTSYTDTGLVSNTVYFYDIFAINAVGSSSGGRSGFTTTLAALLAPGAPTGLTATPTTDGEGITLSWTAPEATGSNDPPTAMAGADGNVNVGSLVQLNGTGNDPDGDNTALTYVWSTTDTTITLNNANTANATFTAPELAEGVESAEFTLILTVTDSGGATGTDSVVITVLPGGSIAEVLDAVVLPEISRATVSQTTAGITRRISQVAEQAVPGTSVVIDGQGFAGDDSGWSQLLMNRAKALAEGNLDARSLLANTSFSMPLKRGGAVEPVYAARTDRSKSGVQRRLATGFDSAAVWVSGAYSNASGDSDLIDWDGDLFGIQAGIDMRLLPSLLGGVAVSLADGNFGYTESDSGASGDYELDITSLHPYLGWNLGRVSLWTTVGYGEGDLELKPDNGNSGSSDLEMTTFAVGGSANLFNGESSMLRLKFSGALTALEIDGSDDPNIIAAEDVDTNQVRLGLEASAVHDLASGASWRPRAEIAARYDGGDGDSGTGIALNLGLNGVTFGGLMTIEGGVHGLFGRDSYREWGVNGLLRVRSGLQGRGFSFQLAPGYGDSSSEVEKIWEQGLSSDDIQNTAGITTNEYAARLNARLDYGMAAFIGTWVPYSEFTLSDDDRQYRLGLSWKQDHHFNIDLLGEQREADKAILLKGEMQF